MTVVVRRDAERGRTRHGGVESRHAYSFGAYYDPAHVVHGLLLALNEDVLQPGAGFPDHLHRDVEVVTWVVRGTLRHRDATGAVAELGRGGVQRLSAGRGVVHSEACAGDGPVRYVQSWVRPAEPGAEPSYGRAQLDDDALRGALVAVAGGDGPVRLGQPDAVLRVGRLAAGQGVRLPDAAYAHLLVLTGSVELAGAGPLATGDGARLTGAGPLRVTAVEEAEVLLWEMNATAASGV